MSAFLEWNAKLTDIEFPQWALDKLDAWAPEQPTLESTDYASTGVCCPYRNAVEPNTEYKDCPPSCCNEEAGAAIHEALMMDDVNTILVAWEHGNIEYLMGTCFSWHIWKIVGVRVYVSLTEWHASSAHYKQ